jgi:hypothetical protein
LPALGIGAIFALFHIAGMLAFAMNNINMLVMYDTALGQRRFRCKEVRPSGPMAVEFEDLKMATLLSSGVKGVKEVSS